MVGRIHDSTVVCVFRVNINNEGRHRVSLVNLYVLGRTPQTKPFAVQALDLKKLIKAFNPREVVIDTNGLGFPQPKCATPKKVVCKTVFNCWDIPLGQSAAKFFPSFFTRCWRGKKTFNDYLYRVHFKRKWKRDIFFFRQFLIFCCCCCSIRN